MMKIKYKKKRRKSHKLYGQKYRGYGQVGRHRHHPGGRGRAGSKDHIKIHLEKEGYVFGAGKGFTRHGIKREWGILNIGRILELAAEGRIPVSGEKERLTIDLSHMKYLKILGRGKVDRPVRIILDKTSSISESAKNKIESVGGELIYKE